MNPKTKSEMNVMTYAAVVVMICRASSHARRATASSHDSDIASRALDSTLTRFTPTPFFRASERPVSLFHFPPVRITPHPDVLSTDGTTRHTLSW